MKRWLLLPFFVLVGLLVALPGAAAVRVDDAKVSIAVVDGRYQLSVENTGDYDLTAFTFTPAATLHVTTLVSSTSGRCQLAGAGFTCGVDLAPPPCMCTPGGNVLVLFTGTGESAGSTVTVGMVTIPATGGGAVTAPVTTPPTTTPPTTTPPKVKPPAVKPKAKAPLCKKGQKSTNKKPCRKK